MAVLAGAVGAGRVAARVLDLEHVGAVVAEQHRGDRRGVNRSQVQDADARERALAVAGSLLHGGRGGGCVPGDAHGRVATGAFEGAPAMRSRAGAIAAGAEKRTGASSGTRR